MDELSEVVEGRTDFTPVGLIEDGVSLLVRVGFPVICSSIRSHVVGGTTVLSTKNSARHLVIWVALLEVVIVCILVI